MFQDSDPKTQKAVKTVIIVGTIVIGFIVFLIITSGSTTLW